MRSGSVATIRTPLVAESGVVASGHQDSAEAGLAVLRRGGTVVDAVVAAAFASFVVEPASCGVGGHGRMSVHLAAPGLTVGIDHFVRAPARATPESYQNAIKGWVEAGRGGAYGAINTAGRSGDAPP
jgi:gamma-glutamyltranspeptidase/glutathione hydrolase